MRSVEGLAECVPYNAPPPRCDYRIYNASLLRALGLRLDTIPAPIPYLHADPARVAHWRERLRPTQRRRIGICWGGLGGSALQRARRLDRATLERLLGADADFVSLQFKAEDEAPLLAAHNVQNFGGDTRDFAELAALIETVDLVISIDTNVAHIAGALGKPLWILLPFTPDWRWLNDRPDTPWYPQARLFRQQSWGDWRSVADDVLAALQ
jgi:ADP-heptose:LPS heptosyltransferase